MSTLSRTENLISLYEELRSRVMKASSSSSGLGLGLFIQRGMTLWMKCWPETVEEERMEEGVYAGKTDYPCLLSYQDEMVDILVNMVSGHREEISHA
jgi:hypothetical protein